MKIEMKYEIGDIVYTFDRETKETFTGKIYCVSYIKDKDGEHKYYCLKSFLNDKNYKKEENELYLNEDLAFADAHGI